MQLRIGKHGLKWILGGLFVALAIPTVVLIRASFGQLEAQALQMFQREAGDLALRIDRHLLAALELEDRRPVEEYGFAIPGSGGSPPRRSPLSVFPVEGSLPGIISYFEVDADGNLSTPLLPEPGVDPRRLGVTSEQEVERASLQQSVLDVLARNRLEGNRPLSQSTDLDTGVPSAAAGESVSALRSLESLSERRESAQFADAAAPAEQTVDQAVFDRLSERDAAGTSEPEADRAASSAQAKAVRATAGRVDAFNSAIERFRFNRFLTGHLVVFRNVWLAGERVVQGALIDPSSFFNQAVGDVLGDTASAQDWHVLIDFDGERIAAGSGGGFDIQPPNDPRDSVVGVHRVRLSPPFASLELSFAALELPAGPALPLLQWLSFSIAAVLCVGFFVIYRMLASEIDLNRRQRDFVSAVSHELKTPLTSIRMYGEMLKSGWADEAKKSTYYQYISDESDRLGRLIDNVLHLARIERAEVSLNTADATVSEVVDLMRSRVCAHADPAGYRLNIAVEPAALSQQISVDQDAFMQIMINLVDNAIKYSRDAERKDVDVTVRMRSGDEIVFAVRDYGPGLPDTKLKKLFQLFYRPVDANTRSVSGTGIGLSLVYELTVRMNGEVDVKNCDPGVEFWIVLPIAR